jgi:hypothetical protein
MRSCCSSQRRTRIYSIRAATTIAALENAQQCLSASFSGFDLLPRGLRTWSSFLQLVGLGRPL